MTRIFQHDAADPNSLSDNNVVSIYRDRSGLLWVGTANGGVNILDLRQEQFRHYTHRPADHDSLSPGKVTAIHEDSDGVLWVGCSPARSTDWIEGAAASHITFPARTTGTVSAKAVKLNTIFKDAHGYLWLGGVGVGLDRFDERSWPVQALRDTTLVIPTG